jgi:adenine-specific DNA-methyltransferase
MEKMYSEGKIIKTNNNLYQKTYLNELKDNVKKISTWWENAGTTSKGTTLIKKLFPEFDVAIFDHPKPIELVELMLEYCHISTGDVVLDFFAGSGTTAHAIFEQNKKENIRIKFILVQYPEIVGKNTDAYKNGYFDISQISKERIRRAGDKILSESKNKEIDIGFKVFKLDSSNLEKWDPDYNNPQKSLYDNIDNIKDDRTEFDLLYEILLKYGVDLTLPIKEYSVNNKNIYSVGFGALLICLDDNITKEIAIDLIKLKEKLAPETVRAVFKDNGFKSDSDKTNIKETLRVNGINEFVTI